MTYKPDLNHYWLETIAGMASEFNTGALTQIAGNAAMMAQTLNNAAEDNAQREYDATARALYHEAKKFRALADACNAVIVLQKVDRKENLTFAHIGQTGLTEEQVVARAKDLQHALEKRFGKGEGGTLQSCVDAVIDGEIERNQ